MDTQFDTIIIGGGAAGLMCAIEAGKRRRTVALIESQEKLGKKILISGGGRCNFTNIHCSPAHYLSENPHFCKSALSRYSPYQFIELVQSYNIAFHEKTLGQQFCDGSSRQIVGLLKEECEKYKVTFFLNTKVARIEKNARFEISTEKMTISSESLVIASGGLSIPKMGASGFGYQIARQFNLSIVEPRPGLVPFTLGQEELKRYSQLSGVSMPCIATIGDRSFKESFLFTHRGLSGPAILQISSYWKAGDLLLINLFPEKSIYNELVKKKKGGENQILSNILSMYLPRSFVEILSRDDEFTKPLNEYSDTDLKDLGDRLSNWNQVPNGTEGFAKAEVTLGGVDTTELSSKTFESNKVSGLFFIGEVVDVTGHLGGFNFQWAWASGHAAGQYC